MAKLRFWLCLPAILSGAGRWNLALALHSRILESGLMSSGEFESTLEDCQRIADNPDIWMTSFMVTQVWGKKPLHA